MSLREIHCRKVSNEIRVKFDEHSESDFLVTAIEALRKNLALKCNAKRNGGLSLLTVLDVKFEHVPDDWRVSARYRDKGRQGSHVKRVMTRFDTPCVNFLKEFKTARPNASYSDFVMTAEPARDQAPEWDGQAKYSGALRGRCADLHSRRAQGTQGYYRTGAFATISKAFSHRGKFANRFLLSQCTQPARLPPCHCCDKAMSWLLRRSSLLQVSLCLLAM